MKKYILLSISLFIYTISYSQTQKVKFGKVEMSELTMNKYDKDTSADAVILYNSGNTYFRWDNDNGQFLYYTEYNFRIKIFKKNALNWANVVISYNRFNDKISGLKAFCFNLENNKIEKYQLKASDVYEEQVFGNYYQKKFAIPNVKEGSVIEYTYTLESKSILSPRNWNFQYSIPVLMSYYSIVFPEFLRYKHTLNGFLYPRITKSDRIENVDVKYTSTPQAGGAVYTDTYVFKSNSNQYEFLLENIPALKEEPYMRSTESVRSYVSFDLYETLSFDKTKSNPVISTWDNIAKLLLEEESFGKQLNLPNSITKEMINVINGKTTDYDKMVAIFEWTKQIISWNGSERAFCTTTIKDAFSKHSGNSADINLFLVAALKEAGIYAKPVILSTRNNGNLKANSPTTEAIDYVICYAKINDNVYYLDATEKYNPVGLLPLRCLNDIGVLISENSQIIKIEPTIKAKESITILLEINNGKIQGKCRSKYENYYAAEYRKYFSELGNNEKIVEFFQTKTNDYKINTIETTPLKDVYSPFSYTINFESNETIFQNQSKIFISPFLFFEKKENPFKYDERKYPVDFGYPFEEIISVTLTIPESYVIESLPKNQKFEFEDKSATYSYLINNVSNIVQISVKLNINKTVYTEEEYKFLKQMYSLIIASQSEQIVLKKID